MMSFHRREDDEEAEAENVHNKSFYYPNYFELHEFFLARRWGEERFLIYISGHHPPQPTLDAHKISRQ